LTVKLTKRESKALMFLLEADLEIEKKKHKLKEIL
jgi:hypothetical protein